MTRRVTKRDSGDPNGRRPTALSSPFIQFLQSIPPVFSGQHVNVALVWYARASATPK
jgi:hypothetical protein